MGFWWHLCSFWCCPSWCQALSPGYYYYDYFDCLICFEINIWIIRINWIWLLMFLEEDWCMMVGVDSMRIANLETLPLTLLPIIQLLLMVTFSLFFYIFSFSLFSFSFSFVYILNRKASEKGRSIHQRSHGEWKSQHSK